MADPDSQARARQWVAACARSRSPWQRAVRERRWSAADVTEAALERIALARCRPARLLHARRRRRARAGRGASTPRWRAGEDGRTARRRAGGGEGPDLHARPAHDLRLRASTPITCPTRTTWSSSACARAGAVIIGKTNTSEFGYGAVGHNPLFADHAQPVEPGAHAGRLERRLGGGGGRAHGAARARQRRRRLGAHPGVAVRACSASSRRGAACRCTRAVATSAIRASRAGSRSSTSARSRAPPPTPRWRSRCSPARRRATATRCRAEVADWRVPAADSAARPPHRLQRRHGPCRGRSRSGARPSNRRRCACSDASGPTCSNALHPQIGDTQSMFEALVALDTDRVGSEIDGGATGRDLDRLAGGARRARLDRRRVHRRD